MSLHDLLHRPAPTPPDYPVFEQLEPFDPQQTVTGEFDTAGNRIRFSAYIGGEDQPLTFVPAGLVGCKETVTRLAIAGAQLGENVVVFDQPRHNIPYTDPVKAHAETLSRVIEVVRTNRLLDYLGIRPDTESPVMLTPHSFGNDSAIDYAIKNPGDVASLVGIAPRGYDKFQFAHFVRNALNMNLREDAGRIRQDMALEPEVEPAIWRHVRSNPVGFFAEVAYSATSTKPAKQSEDLLRLGVPVGVMGFSRDHIIATRVLRGLADTGIDYTEFPVASAHHNTTFSQPTAVMSLAQAIHQRLQGKIVAAA